MAELKTTRHDLGVEDFLNGIEDENKRRDSLEILKLMAKATGAEPKMWGASIIGFGNHHYKYESGREGDWFLAGFSPRKQNLTLYVMSGFTGFDGLLARLGKHKTGKGCLYISRLEDVDLNVLREMIENSVDAVQKGKIKL